MDSKPSSSDDARAVGAVLAGKYEVKRLIGKGGMGSVYEGVHREIGKRVAIKLLETEHSRADEIAARFRREGRAASRIESEHVVQVFDVGEDPTHGLYMVMEFLVGEDLAVRLERENLLDVAVAVDIAWQTARGLAKAHAAGVIHRDLKPGNVFLTRRDDGTAAVKLVDFGISKLMAQDVAHAHGAPAPGAGEVPASSQPITQHGSAVGTPQYMSPEQAQGHAIDHRADVWALGAVLYEMLAGRPAYDLLENYEQTIFAIVLRRPPSLAEVAPWVPPPVVAIVHAALEHDLARRLPDCATFARELSEVARMPDLGARPSGLPHAPIALTRRSSDDEKVVVVPPGGPAASASPTEPPATVTGVSVKTDAHDSIVPEAPPPRRSSRFAIAAVLLTGAVAAGAGFVMLKGRPPSQHAGSVKPAEPPPPVPSVLAPLVEATGSSHLPSPPPVASGAPSAVPSSSVRAPASTKTLQKPEPPRPNPSASGGKPAGEEQFGGTGLTTSF
jgi:serine/threonine protein kinase